MALDSYFYDNVLPRITGVLNVISIVSASIVVLTVIALGIYNRRLINRVSFRIQTVVALCDIIRHVLQYFNRQTKSSLCPLIGLSIHFFDLIYATLNVAIAANMQLMLLNNKYPRRKWEYGYWLCPLLVSSVLTFPFAGMFGDNGRGQCFKKPSAPLKYAGVTSFNITLLLTIVYCIVVPLSILYKLHFQRGSFLKLKSHVQTKHNESEIDFKKSFGTMILKTMMYPLALVLSLSGTITYLFTTYTLKNRLIWADSYSILGRSLAGTFNLLAFMFDPTLHKCLKTIYSNYKGLPSGDVYDTSSTQSLKMSNIENYKPAKLPSEEEGNPFFGKNNNEIREIDIEALLMRYL